MLLKFFLCCLTVFLYHSISGQQHANDPTLIRFCPSIQALNQLEKPNTSPDEKTEEITIETLKFYISKIQLFQTEKLVYAEANSYHLLDLADSSSFLLHLNIDPKLAYNTLHFTLGIDSLTNVSGALDGDLDPTKGMYWTWQSGYINFKLEGSRKNGGDEKKFNFHLGGYLPPFGNAQQIKLLLVPNQAHVITLNLASFFKQIDWTSQKDIMSPGAEALHLAKLIQSLFSVNEAK